jgi:hypothetical protein
VLLGATCDARRHGEGSSNGFIQVLDLVRVLDPSLPQSTSVASTTIPCPVYPDTPAHRADNQHSTASPRRLPLYIPSSSPAGLLTMGGLARLLKEGHNLPQPNTTTRSLAHYGMFPDDMHVRRATSTCFSLAPSLPLSLSSGLWKAFWEGYSVNRPLHLEQGVPTIWQQGGSHIKHSLEAPTKVCFSSNKCLSLQTMLELVR